MGYSCAALHPDGLILCTGMEDATVRIWETRTQKVRTFAVGFQSFCVEFRRPKYKGGEEDATVRIWRRTRRR